jgi:hypothetical protein
LEIVQDVKQNSPFPFQIFALFKVKAFLTSTDSDFYLYYVCAPRHDVADNAVVYTFARVLYPLSKKRVSVSKIMVYRWQL